MPRTYDHIVHIDFETYYDREYSLTKTPTILYVRDSRFKVLGAAVAIDHGPSRWLEPEPLADFLAGIDWSRTAVSAYNCAFDACILTEKYRIFPSYYICPQSAARALLPIDRHNLRTVAPLLGLGLKGDALVEGATNASNELSDYACNDNQLARGIYRMLYPLLSKMEHDLIDQTVKQAVEPKIVLDAGVLTQVRDDAVRSRAEAIAASGVPEDVLVSNAKFAGKVLELGMVPPVKTSPATGEETYAFAKGDDEFVEFMLKYPEHKALWEGRLAAKSNINQTRAEKFLSIAESGPMPMPTLYHGAHTGRASGCDGVNVQNLPSKYKSNLRKAFTAPEGYVICVADSSQIELRLNMWFCGQADKLELLRNGGDIYRAEAAAQFSIAPEAVEKDQRQFGKVVQLGCGYGMGANKFRKFCAAGPLGIDPIYMSPQEAYTAINTYRASNYKVPEMWRELDQLIHAMTLPDLDMNFRGLVMFHEGVMLPSGRALQYPALRQTEEGAWVYGADKKVKFLWGGTLLENIIQALARDIVMEQLLIIREKYDVLSSTHDEALYLAPESEAEEALAFGLGVMSQPPSWAPDLPVSAEGAFDKFYCK